MVSIRLKDAQSGYDAVGEYIQKYWKHNGEDTVIVSIGISRDGKNFEKLNEVACPTGFCDIEFLYDWWEGEKFIRIFGIRAIRELDISGGIYTKD